MHVRVIVHRKVEYQHAQGKGEGMLVDLSLKGCRIKGVYTGSSGSRLRLQLWLPDQSQPVQVELAAVQWIKNNQFGVRFLTVSPDAQARLAQVFQLLHEAQQQPEARAIHIPAFAIPGSKPGSASRGPAEDFGNQWMTADRPRKIDEGESHGWSPHHSWVRH